MWIYRTDDFERQLGEYNQVRSFLEGREERIRDATTRAQASRIAKPYAGFLVTRHQNFRLIGSVERRGARDVFVWHRILLRGDPEYKSFTEYSQTIRQPNLSGDLDRWIAEQRVLEAEASRPDNLPEDLISWLGPIPWIFSTGDDNDVLVYETVEWVTDMASLAKDRWPILQLVQHAVQELASPDRDASTTPINRTAGNLTVVAQKTEDRAVFLLGVRKLDAQRRESAPIPLGDEALPHARRAYPMWLLADDQMWFDIQEGTAYNLALSPEEQLLLHRAAGRTEALSELPMFINGQAGSGKSTMLAYIFAGLCKMKSDLRAGGEPRFVTYNTQLLQKARQTTRKILDAHHDTSTKYRDVDLDPLFCGWHDYLISMLPADQRSKWVRSRRVDYNDFTIAWEGRSGKLPARQQRQKYSAALVWYVIRTLIKGSDAVGELHPDEYAVELSRDERTVSSDVYRTIFEEHYKTWYVPALRDRGLWDDQDLTEAALNAVDDSREPRTVAALVIDEAQDFTRRELRLITRTTAYLDYEMPTLGAGIHPPIILAGDPLQTLSPTGFRWSAIKAGIFEELQGLFGTSAAQPVFTELLKNYRSAKQIVELANSIQLWRAFLFDMPDVRPQEAWSPDPGPHPPLRFVLDQVDEAEFIRFAGDTVLIVPCEEGGEVDYVRNDPTLSKMFPGASDLNPPATVFSAASIKGLEYEKVLLYKFGEAARELTWSPRAADDDARDLLAEYFFNKLYVAATRATHSLYAVDTPAGDAALWERLSTTRIKALLNEAGPRGINHFTEAHVTGIEDGSADLSGVQEKNPRENAIRTKGYANETRSARKMRQAASYFRQVGERRESDECEAWALQFEGNLLGAGRKFAEALCATEAWRCLWDHKAWPDLGSLAAQGPDVPRLEFAAVLYMVTDRRNLDDLAKLALAMSEAGAAARFSGETWAAVVDQVAADAQQLTDSTDKDTARTIAEGLDVLFESGFRAVGPVTARAYARSGNSFRARHILEASPAGDREVAMLLFGLEGAPQGLRHLAAAGLNEGIRTAWQGAGRPYGDEWMTFLLPALNDPRFATDRLTIQLERGDIDGASATFLQHRDWGGQFAGYARRIIESFGAQSLPADALPFIEAANSLPNRRLSKAEMHQILVRSLAERFERDGWHVSPQYIKELRDSVDQIYKALQERNRFDKLQSENVPALGALCELAGYSRWARKLYLKYVEAPDGSLRDYCRRRSLLMITEELKETGMQIPDRAALQAQQHEDARRWNLEVDQRSHRLAASLRDRVAETPVPRPTGNLGSVSWSYKPGDTLHLDFDDDADLYATSKINLEGDGHRARGVEVSPIENGQIVATAGPFKVAISVSSELRMTVSEGDTELGSVLVAIRAGAEPLRPAPTKRTARAPQAATRSRPGGHRETGQGKLEVAHKFANQLGIELKDLLATAKLLGLKPQRGSDKFTMDEQMQIRAEIAKRKPQTEPPAEGSD